MSNSLAIISGGTAGTLALLVIVCALLWYFKSRLKSLVRRNSDTGSSDPSALAEWNRGGGSGSAAGAIQSEPQWPRQFTMEELEQATKRFDEGNLIGYGSFGSVYKGLLRDGTVVAIKRRRGDPKPEFVAEVVSYLSEIRHRNLVSLLGYCLENGFQMLIFEYLPSGSMSNHLYDTGQESSTKLEFKQRISIACGAAKGLCHLHSLKPPLVHKNFKTANVLVDEDFIAKVADARVLDLLEKIEEAGPSRTSVSVFQDPEAGTSRTYSETSDVYSFGVFLLELVTGVDVSRIDPTGSHENLIRWVESRESSNKLVDPRLVGTFTAEGMRDLIRLTLLCILYPGERRPKMDMVVSELERIREKEMTLTSVMGEGTSTITPGSELFMAK